MGAGCGNDSWAKSSNGTKPADLPVEEPAKLEVAVNATTAKALGITIPASVLSYKLTR